MGYSKLHYDEYMDNIDFWSGQLNIKLPLWADELSAMGCNSISALDFYDDIFNEYLEEHRLPEDYKSGEYGGIVVERIQKNDKIIGKRTTITKGNNELYNLIDKSNNFCMLAPLSYAGRHRTNKNARYLYALVIEIDDIEPKHGIDELFYSWKRKQLACPRPTYIVCSGTGLHLYFVFERPIPLYQYMFAQLSAAKTFLTGRFWNKYVTRSYSYDKIQYEGINQPFRCVGTICKMKNQYAMAFVTGDKVTIEYINQFIPDVLHMDIVYKSKLTLAEARNLYPNWYKNRIVEGNEKGHWDRHPGIYYNWIDKIKSGANVGHRYNCLENLCSLAVQCNIPPEQIEKDCRELAVFLEELTISEDNHFTEYDIICALKTYYNADEMTYRRNIDFISLKTGIKLNRNKRNGRKRKDHIVIMNVMKDAKKMLGEIHEGRPDMHEIVRKWREEHPNGKKSECIKDTGLSKPTVYKWWD